MSEYTMDYQGLAERIASNYGKHQKVKSVVLAGSVARGWSDEFSDIELYIIWEDEPTNDDRMSVINDLNGESVVLHPFEDDEWADNYFVEGVKIEVSSFLEHNIEEWINEIIENFTTKTDIHFIASSIIDGIPLYGEETALRWKIKLNTFPEELKVKIINENINVSGRWRQRYTLAEREDYLVLYSLIVFEQKRLLNILFGLNEMYIQHPDFKWLENTLSKMQIKPIDSIDRFKAVYRFSPKVGIKMLEQLMDDVFELANDFLKKSTLKI
jgi:predicted nucleotidyltransferase